MVRQGSVIKVTSAKHRFRVAEGNPITTMNDIKRLLKENGGEERGDSYYFQDNIKFFGVMGMLHAKGANVEMDY